MLLPSTTMPLIQAKSGGKLQIALKNESRQELEAMLTAMGLFAMCLAGGNAAMLTSTGFTLTKPRTPQKLGDPGTISLSNGINTGELTINLKPVKGGRSYMHEISGDPLLADGSWTSVFSSTSKYTFINLEQGKKYAARVLVVGSVTQTAYTPVATMYVQ